MVSGAEGVEMKVGSLGQSADSAQFALFRVLGSNDGGLHDQYCIKRIPSGGYFTPLSSSSLRPTTGFNAQPARLLNVELTALRFYDRLSDSSLSVPLCPP